jgi:hypothetical protein
MSTFFEIAEQLAAISTARAGRFELGSAAEILCGKYDLEGEEPKDSLGHPGEEYGTWVFDGTVPKEAVWAALQRRGEIHPPAAG